MTRTIIAFLVAPLWVPVLFWFVASLSVGPTVGFADIVAVVACFFAYLTMLVVGVPALLFLRARNWTGFRLAAIIGPVVGVLTAYLALVAVCLARGPEFMNLSALQDAFDPITLLTSGIVGTLVTMTFWIIARPDRGALRAGTNSEGAA